jgi:hypothetical protein
MVILINKMLVQVLFHSVFLIGSHAVKHPALILKRFLSRLPSVSVILLDEGNTGPNPESVENIVIMDVIRSNFTAPSCKLVEP